MILQVKEKTMWRNIVSFSARQESTVRGIICKLHEEGAKWLPMRIVDEADQVIPARNK